MRFLVKPDVGSVAAAAGALPGPAPAASLHDWLARAIIAATGSELRRRDMERLRAVPDTDMRRLRGLLSGYVPARFSLTGTLDQRILFVECDPAARKWIAADLSGHPLAVRSWPDWTSNRIVIEQPRQWQSAATLTDGAAYRLERPRILLTALYHPEWFPLPRFPLAISDIARAARATLSGQVELMDMQLGISLEDIVQAVATRSPDIVGISATFGQHDLLIQLLDYLESLPCPPLVIAGGSLTARNEALLLERYPRMLVARSAGEPTIADLIAFWHSDLALPQVRGIGYTGSARGCGTYGLTRHKTPALPNRVQANYLPELDLLDDTFAHKGVAQLEASRGCTSACSFCPRGHKGAWAGTQHEQLQWMLAAMGSIFQRHPEIARVVYLVDEEFIGRGTDSVPRALAIASAMHQAGFAWESSCRIDQVVRLDCDRHWHIERARMWRQLVAGGLRRMLFGVESGVDSILDRFNKDTTSEQNVLAIRTLSALGVPTRFTYITFDHLMNTGELAATYAFQGRTDLLLRPLPGLTADEIADGVRDPSFVAANAVGRPFYTAISYMLVSMECLTGAAYTRAVQAAGLAGAARPSLGRVDADFADWRIGSCSQHAQLWIDRNFALDYTLKSLEKILDGEPCHHIRTARVVLKESAYALLGRMLAHVTSCPDTEVHRSRFSNDLRQIMDEELLSLSAVLSEAISAVVGTLPEAPAELLCSEHARWQNTGEWHLINAADPCGT